MSKQRVVVTGLGVLSPNAHGKEAFEQALRQGKSGVRHIEKLAELKFTCQVGAVPQEVDSIKHDYFSDEQLLAMNDAMIFGAIAAIDCWRDAGLPAPSDTPDWDTGAIIGTGISGLDTIGKTLVPKTDAGKVRRLGSTMVEQIMASSASANIGGILGLGGQVTTNSSACTTGTEAIANGYHTIQAGRAKRVLCGGTEGASEYSWAGFDAMRVLSKGYNDAPEKASRPMSQSAAGFVPSSGAGLVMLESLDSALARGATIYAEIVGAHVNCGGQRGGGSITFPNPTGVVKCIQEAMREANIKGSDIDLINGHLTATMADPFEIKNWQNALGLSPEAMPSINATKSLIGHALGAAGGLEIVATLLQLHHKFIHASLNCDDLHEDIQPYSASIVRQTTEQDIQIAAKASFGFGDVNGCLIFKKYVS